MKPKTIIITGANGFIGGFLRHYFTQKGDTVYAFLRKPNPENSLEIGFDLEQDINESPFLQADYLIHCAYMKADNHPNSDQVNTQATLKLLALCEKYNTKMIFFSTLSAHQDAESQYGKHKLALEAKINTNIHTILRPGLVLGRTGLFADMLDFARTKKIIPLIAAGKQPLQYVPIEIVAQAVENCINLGIIGKFNLASIQIPSYQEFQRTLCRIFKISAFFISIPLWIVQTAVFFGDFFKITLPITQENILGLKHLRSFQTKEDLQKLQVQIPDLETVFIALAQNI